MREEIRQEVVMTKNVTVYIADDGTEFKKKHECEDYEFENITKALLKKLQKCEDAEGLPNCNAGYVSDCYEYNWYFIRNHEDVEILNEAYGLGITDKYIGDWLCLETEGCCREAWFSTASEGIAYTKDLLTKLGYKVEITREVE